MAEAKGSVSGSNNGHAVLFYGLSTCVWCKKTREYLESQGVEFDFVYLDLLDRAERDEALAAVRKWNPRTSFPTIVIDDSRAVLGYQPEELAEVLGP